MCNLNVHVRIARRGFEEVIGVGGENSMDFCMSNNIILYNKLHSMTENYSIVTLGSGSRNWGLRCSYKT